MTEELLHGALVWVVIATALPTFLYLMRNTAPYGRHHSGAEGAHLSSRLGWVVMEAPAAVVFLLVHVAGSSAGQLVPLLFLVLWQIHYVNRSFLYPLRLRANAKRIPVSVVVSGVFFNSINAYINARFISELGQYDVAWLGDPRFVAGLGIFLAGMALNLHSDETLLRMRRPGGSGYAIPQGRAFRFVSCPNYLGEIVQWGGWALATWSLSGLAFWVFTAANLAPRARSHHRWYQATFPDYPPRRRALLPGIY